MIKSVGDLKALADYVNGFAVPEMERFFECMHKLLAGEAELLRPINHLREVDWSMTTPQVFGCEVEVDANVVPARMVFLPGGSELVVVGDLHGDARALLEILFNSNYFERLANNENVQLLFLGDYTDRGRCSLYTLILVCLLKLQLPHNVTLLRGNHEAVSMAEGYGFYDELCKRWNHVVATDLLDTITKLWQGMSYIAFTRDGMMFMHGGLPKLDYANIANLNALLADEGCLTDIIWSDPKVSCGLSVIEEFPPSNRGLGHYFSPQLIAKYLSPKLGIVGIVRGHEAVGNGYVIWEGDEQWCSAHTLFSTGRSSPNSFYSDVQSPRYLNYSPALVLASSHSNCIPSECFHEVHSINSILLMGVLFGSCKLYLNSWQVELLFSWYKSLQSMLCQDVQLAADLWRSTEDRQAELLDEFFGAETAVQAEVEQFYDETADGYEVPTDKGVITIRNLPAIILQQAEVSVCAEEVLTASMAKFGVIYRDSNNRIDSIAELQNLVFAVINGGPDRAVALLLRMSLLLVPEMAGVFRFRHMQDIEFPEKQAKVLLVTTTGARVVLLPKDGLKYFLGDLYGDFWALLNFLYNENILHRLNSGENIQIVFMGNLIERGEASVELLFAVYILKLFYQHNFYFIRGNQETEEVTRPTTEFIAKYNMTEPHNKVYGWTLYESLRNYFETMSFETNGFGDDPALYVYNFIYGLWQYHPYAVFTPENYMALHGGIPHIDHGVAGNVEAGLMALFHDENHLEQILWNEPGESPEAEDEIVEMDSENSMVRFWQSKRYGNGGNSCFFNWLLLDELHTKYGICGLLCGHELQSNGFLLWASTLGLPLVSFFSTGNGSSDSAYQDDDENQGCGVPSYLVYRTAQIQRRGVVTSDFLPIFARNFDKLTFLMRFMRGRWFSAIKQRVLFSYNRETNVIASDPIELVASEVVASLKKEVQEMAAWSRIKVDVVPVYEGDDHYRIEVKDVPQSFAQDLTVRSDLLAQVGAKIGWQDCSDEEMEPVSANQPGL